MAEQRKLTKPSPDEVLRRMLSTPPQPHKSKIKKKTNKPKK
jgi:hypothetical protein